MGVAQQKVHHREPAGRLHRVIKVVHARHVAQEVVIAFRIITQETHDPVQIARLHDKRRLPAKLGRAQPHVGEGRLDPGERGMVEIRLRHAN